MLKMDSEDSLSSTSDSVSSDSSYDIGERSPSFTNKVTKSGTKTIAAIKIQSVIRGINARKRHSVSTQLGRKDYAGPNGELASGSTGWTIHAAPDGKQFWQHKDTSKPVWVEPPECREYREATSVNGWTVHPAPNGLPYWFNSNTKESVWNEPKEMKSRRTEYMIFDASVRQLRLGHSATPHKRASSSLSAFSLASPASKANEKHNSSLNTSKVKAKGNMQIKNVAQVLKKLRSECADSDPIEAFNLFAMTTSGRGEYIPVSVFVSSIMKICPTVNKTLASATASVFDRSGSGLISEKTFVDIIYDRAEIEKHASHDEQTRMLQVLSDFRDILASKVHEDGRRGFSESELKRHFDNMKRYPKDDSLSRGQLVSVMREIGLHEDTKILHAVAIEFIPLNRDSVNFKNFVYVVKRENDKEGTHKEIMRKRAYSARTIPRPTLTQRTKREANKIIARFQKNFQTQTSSIEHLHAVFEAFDRYGDGHINRADFRLAMRELDFSRSSEALNVVLDVLDPEQTGYIAWHSFFDTLATEATSGLTPRCLTIDSKIAPPSSPKRRNHGFTMSPARRRIHQKQRPPQYPSLHGEVEKMENNANEKAQVCILKLRERMRQDASKFYSSAVEKNRRTSKAKDFASPSLDIGNSNTLSYCIEVFDGLDKMKAGAISARKLFQYIKSLKLTKPAPNTELIWHAVSLIDKSGDGTIHLYDWLLATVPGGLKQFAGDLLNDIRSIYHENLLDPAGRSAFCDMFKAAKNLSDDVAGISNSDIVPFEKFLSAVASMQQGELTSIIARYLWGKLAGEDSPHMLWTEFLVAMTDRSGMFGFRPRPLGGTPRSIYSPRPAYSPNVSLLEKSPDGLLEETETSIHKSISMAERVNKERLSSVWKELFNLIKPDAGTSYWQKIDTLRAEYSRIASFGSTDSVTQEQFVRLLRNLGIFEQGEIMMQIAKEFDLEEKGVITWLDFVLGLLEWPVRTNEKYKVFNDDSGNIRKETRGWFHQISNFFELEKESISTAHEGADTSTLRQRLNLLIKKFSSCFDFRDDNISNVTNIDDKIESLIMGMTYDEFESMITFVCQIGAAEQHSQCSSLNLDAFQWMCSILDRNQDETVDTVALIACMMPRFMFRDNILDIKKEDLSTNNAVAEGKPEKNLLALGNDLLDLSQKTQREDDVEDVEVEGGTNVESASNKTSKGTVSRGEAEMSIFDSQDSDTHSEPDDNEISLGILEESEMPTGDGAAPEFEENIQKVGEVDLSSKPKKDSNSLSIQLHSNQERLSKIIKICENNAQLCREIDSSHLLAEHRQKLKNKKKAHYAKVPGVIDLINNDGSDEKSLLEALTVHAGITSMLASNSSGSGDNLKKSLEIDHTIRRSLAQWNSALDTWNEVLDLANISMRKIFVSVAPGNVTAYEAAKLHENLSNVAVKVHDTKMEIYRESDYWFERNASRQSGAMRFLRNVRAPPQFIYEQMLKISSEFRNVESRISKIKKQLKLHTPRDNATVLNPKTSSDNKRLDPTSKDGPSQKKQLLDRIKEKEKVLQHERRKALNMALATRGISWPPVLMDTPAWCIHLHKCFIQFGASAVSWDNDELYDTGKTQKNSVKIKPEVGKKPTTRTDTAANLTIEDTGISIPLEKTSTRRLVDRVAEKIVIGLGKATRQNDARALACGYLNHRTREIESALSIIGLGNAHPAVIVTSPYNDYVTQTVKGNVWVTVAKICHCIEKRRRSRKKTLSRIFRMIDVEGVGFITKKSLLKFAVNGISVEHDRFFPECISTLFQGRHYKVAIQEASSERNGRVSCKDFVSWASARWKPELPSTDKAARELQRRAKTKPKPSQP